MISKTRILMNHLFLVFFASIFLTFTVSANDITTGEYSGIWKDTFESWNGRFVLNLETITDENIAGTLHFTKAGRCTRTHAFEVPYSGQNHLDFKIKVKTPCEYFHIVLDYDNGVFNGTYKDQLGSGRLTKVKLK